MGCCSSTAADVARQRQQREIAANGLREACRRGDPVMIKAFMRDEFQASSENFVNTADEFGNRPLHLVIAAGDHAECVFELLTLGADPEAVDPSGLTPLLLAGVHRRPGSARVLLEYGAEHTVRGGVDNLGVVDLAGGAGTPVADYIKGLLDGRGEKEVAKAKVRLRDLRFGPPAM